MSRARFKLPPAGQPIPLPVAIFALVCLTSLPSQLFARSLNGSHFIVGGQSENRYPAVGALIDDGASSCTGTLITPTYVLTAAHCVVGSAQGARFFIGADIRNSSAGTEIPVDAYIPHSLFDDGDFYDIGLVRLAHAATVEPITYATELTEAIIGQSPLFVGYGSVSSNDDGGGEKRSAAIPITELDSDSFTYEGQGVNTCFGDSGGPALLEIDGTLQVIGVTSWGDDDCSEFGVNTRTDTYRDFIECVLDGGVQCGSALEDTPDDPIDSVDSDDDESGGEDDYPDDWCTNGDGWCDEPCDTVDSDCLEEDASSQDPDGDTQNEGDPIDSVDSGDDGVNPEGSDSDLAGADDPSSDSETTDDGDASGEDTVGDVEQGGCAASTPADLLGLLFLVGIGIIRRRVNVDQQEIRLRLLDEISHRVHHARMIKTPIAVSLALLLNACMPTEQTTPPSHTVASTQAAIVNGTRAPQNTFLNENQMLAIGFLAGLDGGAFCTGTLIEPRVVMTASHCTQGRSPSNMVFGMGLIPRTDEAKVFPVGAILEHPSVDFAILILGIDPTVTYPELETIAMNREPLTDEWKERWVDASGYGDTKSDDSGRFFASVQLESFDDEIVQVNGHGEQGICYGDSGGPILWQPDPETPPVVVGTEQWGDETCVDLDYLTRVDLVADWVDTQLANGLPPELEPCSESEREQEGQEAICIEDVLTSCTQGYLIEQDCAASGQACGYMGRWRGYQCLPAECGEIDYHGACEGGVLYYCSRRGLRSEDCTAQGQICTYVSEDEGYSCEPCLQCGGDCVDPLTSMEHCGGCDQACVIDHGRGECIEGVCELADCQEGYEDADGDASNGCEVGPPEPEDGNGGGTKSGDDGCHATPLSSLSLILGWYALMGLRRRRRLHI